MDSHDNADIDALTQADPLIEQLDALQPGRQQQKTALFQKLYPAIERALGRDVPQKAIIAQLTTMGLPLSPGGFRALLQAERKQRAGKGKHVRCECCGSALPAPVTLASLVHKEAPRLEAGN